MADVWSIIDGEQHTEDGAGELTVRNPADTEDVVAVVRTATPGTFAAAAASAHAAQRQWSKVPAPVRGVAIHKLGRLLEDNKEALSQLITREIGKPITESRGEVQEAIDTCIFFASEGRRLYGQTVLLPRLDTIFAPMEEDPARERAYDSLDWRLVSPQATWQIAAR